jgi:hypothetical protein
MSSMSASQLDKQALVLTVVVWECERAGAGEERWTAPLADEYGGHYLAHGVLVGVVVHQHLVPAHELANRTVGKASLRKSDQILGVNAIIAALRRDCQS